jgi:integrase
MMPKLKTNRKIKKRGDGEGSVFVVRGRWRAQLPYSDRGVRRFVTKSFSTKGDADRWITNQRQNRFQGYSIAPERRPLGAFLDEWLELRKKKWSPKMARSYQDFVKLHLKPGLGDVRLDKLTTPDVQAFLNRKADETHRDGRPKYSPKTIKHLRDTLRAALNVAVDWNIIRSNPAKKAEPPKQREQRLRVFSAEEAKKFLDAVEDHREGPLFRLILALGLRKGEALGLKLKDLDLDVDPPMVHIRGALQAVGDKVLLGPPKTKSAVRSLPLSPQMAAALRKHLERRETLKSEAGDSWAELGYVFTTAAGTPIYPRNLNRSLNIIIKTLNIPHLRVHDLRHSAATFAIADRVPATYVQNMLGHSDIRTTLGVYAKVLPAALGEATSTLERVIGLVTDKATDAKAKRRSKSRSKA